MSTHSKQEAKAQVQSVLSLMNRLWAAQDEDDWQQVEEIQERIYEEPLEVSVRSDWHTPGETGEPSEYRVLLCTGGPHVEIRGDLNRHGEPDTARVLSNDWFEGNQRLPLEEDEAEAVMEFARCFYYVTA
jgi:hypothetical protein